MITPTHMDLHPRFRPFFCPIGHPGVGEFTNAAAIIECCISRSMNAADMMNQWCSRDAVIQDNKRIEVLDYYG
jgi:hypothetical protein